MQGKVKWFSQEKGYGFVLGEDGIERYFNVQAIQGTDLPKNDDVVDFDSVAGSKGPRAVRLTIVAKSQRSSSSGAGDDRVVCSHCGKRMIPRLLTYRGKLEKSVCPFCGGTYKKFSCFIATAVYGDAYAPEVIALRRFRDEQLEPVWLGRLAIAGYYRVSPPIARFISRHPAVAALIRPLLSWLADRNQ